MMKDPRKVASSNRIEYRLVVKYVYFRSISYRQHIDIVFKFSKQIHLKKCNLVSLIDNCLILKYITPYKTLTCLLSSAMALFMREISMYN